MKKIAIIGTAQGQRELYIRAQAAGYFTIGFSYNASAEIQKYINDYYQISIIEKDKIVEICKAIQIDGVVTNGSELTIQIASYVAEKLGLPCTPYDTILKLQNKSWVREVTSNIPQLLQIRHYLYDNDLPHFLPCIIKPVRGSGKKGVTYADNIHSFNDGIIYAQEDTSNSILIEEYIAGHEISVESISFNGKHYVIQITDKDTSGPPHFVELGHHQPSKISNENKSLIATLVPQILHKVGFVDGASHIEMKISDKGIYLIEVNPRGGGDEISNQLVRLSTDFDYILSMIQVAVGDFQYSPVSNKHYAGIYFLVKQTEYMLPFFINAKKQEWHIDSRIETLDLQISKGNSEHNGYIVYQSDTKIEPNNTL